MIKKKFSSIKDLIPYQKYLKIHHSTPYILHWQRERQSFIYIGVQHNNNPKAFFYRRIEFLFYKWLKTSPTNPIVLLETWKMPVFSKSSKKMILKYGESGFLFYLAKQNNIPTESPEPTQQKIFTDLLHHTSFKKEDINTWILCGEFLQKLARQKKFKKEHSLITKMQSPFMQGTRLNDIAAAINLMRDHLIVENILKLLDEGKSIFAVYGVNHVVLQEKVLNRFFKKGDVGNHEDGPRHSSPQN